MFNIKLLYSIPAFLNNYGFFS